MIFPSTSYYPTSFLTASNFGLHLRRLCRSKSLQILSANKEFRLTQNSASILNTRPSIISVTVFGRGFSLVQVFRSGAVSMADSLKPDGLPAPNGHATAAAPASLANYSFPRSRLKALSDSKKIPLVLMACGSLSVRQDHSSLHVWF